MNGLEAIRLMEQGKIVTDGKEFWKIENEEIVKSNKKMKDWFGIYKFLMEGDYEEYTSPKPLTGWGRTEHLECAAGFYVITECDVLAERISYNHVLNKKCYENANYFSKKEKAEEINFKQTLFRKLQRFSDENGGNEIKIGQKVFTIFLSANGGLELLPIWSNRIFGNVVFASKETAERAIELFHDELIKYFTM